MFELSFNQTLELYRSLIPRASDGRLQLTDLNLDTGGPVVAGQYTLADRAYAQTGAETRRPECRNSRGHAPEYTGVLRSRGRGRRVQRKTGRLEQDLAALNKVKPVNNGRSPAPEDAPLRKAFQRYWRQCGSSSPCWAGMITANVDNDAGGIYTYSQAGAKYGYLPLWSLIPITILLIVTQEMCSRMGAVTGKGLADLIREEFGLRATFCMMVMLVFANLTNVMAEFAGIASSLELFHISRYISVPLSAVAVWWLVVRGNYRSVEKIFLGACVIYMTYIVSGLLVAPTGRRPPMPQSARCYAEPGLHHPADRPDRYFHRTLDAVLLTIGGSRKGITAKEYAQSRVEVVVGCIFTDVVAFFIIVACAGAIWKVPPATSKTPPMRPWL